MTLLVRVLRRGPQSLTAKCNLTCHLQEAFMHLGRGHTNRNAISTAYLLLSRFDSKSVTHLSPSPLPSLPFSANHYFISGAELPGPMKDKMTSRWHCVSGTAWDLLRIHLFGVCAGRSESQCVAPLHPGEGIHLISLFENCLFIFFWVSTHEPFCMVLGIKTRIDQWFVCQSCQLKALKSFWWGFLPPPNCSQLFLWGTMVWT